MFSPTASHTLTPYLFMHMSVRNLLIVFETKMLSLLTCPHYSKNLTYSNLIVYFMLFFNSKFYAYILCVIQATTFVHVRPWHLITLCLTHLLLKKQIKYSKGKDMKDGHVSFMYFKKERRRGDQSITYLIYHKPFWYDV